MEEEAEKLKQLQSEVDKQMNMGSPPGIGEYLSAHILFLSKSYNPHLFLTIIWA